MDMQERWIKEAGAYTPSLTGPQGSRRSHTPREEPLLAPGFGQEEWCSRHHIVPSMANRLRTPTQRYYFDALPQVRLRGSCCDDLRYVGPRDWDDASLSKFELKVREQLHQVERAGSMRVGQTSPSDSAATPPPHATPDSAGRFGLADLSRPGSSAEAAAMLLAFSSEEFGALAKQCESGTSPPPRATPQGRVSAENHFPMPAVQASASSSRGPSGRKRRQDDASKRIGQMALANVEGAKTFMQFINWAEAKFGNLLSVWKLMDADGSMSVSKVEFLKSLREHNYEGKPFELWEVLDRDHSGIVSFIEFAPEAALDLAQFKHWADTHFGGVIDAFVACDSDKRGKMGVKEFFNACVAIGLPERLHDSLHTLVAMLHNSHDRKTRGIITKDQIVFLDAWKPPEYIWVSPDFNTRVGFQNALAMRHSGNHLLAWRKTLDKDGSMRVNWQEFKDACHKMMRAGISSSVPRTAEGIAALFCAFDHSRSGWFTLRDWHVRSWEVLRSFTHWARQKYGKVSRSITEWEESPGEGIRLNAFRRQTKELEFSPDESEELFEGLSLEVTRFKDGSLRRGTIVAKELWFLDKWRPDDELAEVEAWKEMASKRISLPGDASFDNSLLVGRLPSDHDGPHTHGAH